MGELQQLHYHPSDLQTPAAAPPQSAQSETSDDPPPPPSSSTGNEPFPPQPLFDPSRMIGIIRRKALIKDLAAVYHAECLTYCQELLEVQKKLEEVSFKFVVSSCKCFHFLYVKSLSFFLYIVSKDDQFVWMAYCIMILQIVHHMICFLFYVRTYFQVCLSNGFKWHV